MRDGREVTTRVHRVWRDDEGIVRVDGLAVAEQTRADAEQVVAAILTIAGQEERVLLLADMRQTKSMDRGARAYYASLATPSVLRACALLIGSPLTRVIASFTMGLTKPIVPTRLFTSEAEALAWLRGFVA
jgi:hypothetical protein